MSVVGNGGMETAFVQGSISGIVHDESAAEGVGAQCVLRANGHDEREESLQLHH